MEEGEFYLLLRLKKSFITVEKKEFQKLCEN